MIEEQRIMEVLFAQFLHQPEFVRDRREKKGLNPNEGCVAEKNKTLKQYVLL
jgi:hypothetical protein